MEAGGEINGCDHSDGVKANACGGSPKIAGENAGPAKMAGQSSGVKSCSCCLQEVDQFYGKLTKFHQLTSGLSFIFDLRDSRVDLFLLYKDVTNRGGFCQVTKDRKWVEVSAALNTKAGVSIPPSNTQMIYANLLYQFEQTNYYRIAAKVLERLQDDSTGSSSADSSSSSSTGKRKHCGNVDDDFAKKRVCLKSSFQWPEAPKTEDKNLVLQTASDEMKPVFQQPSEEKNPVLQTPKKVKGTKKKSITKETKYPNPPMGYRTGYMIFLRMECERLKKIHGESSAGQVRDMAIDAWRKLPKDGREPYVEASKIDKVRYIREMAAYENMYAEITETENVATCTKPSNMFDFARPNLQTDSDYHVPLPADIGSDTSIATNELVVDFTGEKLDNSQPIDRRIVLSTWEDEFYSSLQLPGKD